MASKPRRWEHLRGKFPSAPVNPTYEQALQAATDAFAGCELSVLAEKYNAVADRLEDLSREESDLKLELQAITTVMDRRMEAMDLQQTVTQGYRWSRSVTPYANVEDRPAFQEWAFEHLKDNLSVHPSTLNAHVKHLIETAEPLPPGIDVFLKSGIERRKV